MIIHSFVRSDFGFRPIQVEVVLTPGLSQVQILGLADQVIKESSKRILSALRHQGFRLPPGKQALVNLHPHNIRKTSQGLDLAIALGILLESEQLSQDIFDFKNNYCYGALSLKGEVLVPQDLKLLNFEKFNKKLLMAQTQESWRFDSLQMKSLSEIDEMNFVAGSEDLYKCKPMALDDSMEFEQSMARLMAIVALGEHPLLIAGSAGGGKTTLVEHLATLLGPPEEKCFLESQKYWISTGRELETRPVVQPHHSATALSVVGGGRPLKFGEISLAHGGALILDELLEFHPSVQNALREPMEKGVIYLTRTGVRKTFPAQSLVLATTNLCPCGSFRPGMIYQCRCSSLRLRQYIEKLTGPFLDRFSIFHIYEKPKIDLKVKLTEIKEQVERGIAFRKMRHQERPNQFLLMDRLFDQLEKKIVPEMIPNSKSLRRRQSLLRVARTLADMEESELICSRHLEEAQTWTASDIYKLECFRAEDFAAR